MGGLSDRLRLPPIQQYICLAREHVETEHDVARHLRVLQGEVLGLATGRDDPAWGGDAAAEGHGIRVGRGRYGEVGFLRLCQHRNAVQSVVGAAGVVGWEQDA